MEKMLKLTISKDVENQILYLCQRHPDLEWSGIIYLKELNSPNSFEELELEVIYLHPMVIAKSSTFEWEMDESIIDLYEAKPELECMTTGLIHSHCNMGVSFSSTDIDELKENCGNYSYYVSLIVNNRLNYAAKVARKVTTKFEKEFFVNGNSVKTSSEVEAVIINDFKLYTYPTVLEDCFKNRYKAIKKEKEEKEKKEPVDRFKSISFDHGYGADAGFDYSSFHSKSKKSPGKEFLEYIYSAYDFNKDVYVTTAALINDFYSNVDALKIDRDDYMEELLQKVFNFCDALAGEGDYEEKFEKILVSAYAELKKLALIKDSNRCLKDLKDIEDEML